MWRKAGRLFSLSLVFSTSERRVVESPVTDLTDELRRAFVDLEFKIRVYGFAPGAQAQTNDAFE